MMVYACQTSTYAFDDTEEHVCEKPIRKLAFDKLSSLTKIHKKVSKKIGIRGYGNVLVAAATSIMQPSWQPLTERCMALDDGVCFPNLSICFEDISIKTIRKALAFE